MNKKDSAFSSLVKSGQVMPPIEVFERERIEYINGMKDYLQNLKSLPHDEAVKVSRENLIRSNIIKESGEFTEQYKHSKIYADK